MKTTAIIGKIYFYPMVSLFKSKVQLFVHIPFTNETALIEEYGTISELENLFGIKGETPDCWNMNAVTGRKCIISSNISTYNFVRYLV